MQDYMAKLYRVSEAIRLFVDQDTYGHAMIRMAQANNIQLKFAIISSTGQPVGPNNTLVGRARPMRVLDPLFWTLELQSR
jgi:hypothetical protein